MSTNRTNPGLRTSDTDAAPSPRPAVFTAQQFIAMMELEGEAVEYRVGYGYGPDDPDFWDGKPSNEPKRIWHAAKMEGGIQWDWAMALNEKVDAVDLRPLFMQWANVWVGDPQVIGRLELLKEKLFAVIDEIEHLTGTHIPQAMRDSYTQLHRSAMTDQDSPDTWPRYMAE